MSVPIRKIGFYSIRLLNKEDETLLEDPQIIFNILEFIKEKDKIERRYIIEKIRKFFVLDFYNDSILNLIFKSAKYLHKPKLIDKETVQERPNPKTDTEGDMELTHVALKRYKNEIFVALEERNVGVTIGKIINYISEFAIQYHNLKNTKQNYKIDSGIVIKDNFIEELRNLKRVNVCDLYLDKQLLGSDELNFSDRLEEVQDNLILEVKANKKQNIKSVVEKCFNTLSGTTHKIKKIRAYGFNDSGNKILLDTEIIKKIEHLNALLTPDDVVDTDDMFTKLNKIMEEL